MQERLPALVFSVHGCLYGLMQNGGASLLPWLQRYTPPGPVPGVPAWLLGLLSVQGTVQAIVDLGAFMGLGPSLVGENSRLIFIERDEIRVGLLVDSAAGIRYFESVTEAGYSEAAPLVAGEAYLNGQHINVLDGAALIDALARALNAPTASAPVVSGKA